MNLFKIISDLDKVTQKIERATKTLERISNVSAPKTASARKPLSLAEREKLVKARIKEKGLPSLFRDVYPDL